MRTSNIALQRLLLILTLIVISSTVVLLLIEKKPMINRSSHDQDQPPDALFIEVNSDGLYKISLSDLQDQGLGIDNLDPETVRLTNQGAEIPYYIVEDNLVFLGQSSPSRYTNTNSYLLELNKSGKIIEEKIVSANSGPINERINNELRLENNLFYDGKLINQLKQSNRINEPWFWSTIHVGGSFLVEVDIPNLSTGAGELRIA